jgi:purine nucleoside permease
MSDRNNAKLCPRSQWFTRISKLVSSFLVLWLAVFFLATAGKADDPAGNLPTPDHPLKVKVVVLTTFEIGADTGDTPGEFQFWVERRKMNTVIPLTSAYHNVRTDGTGVIATVTGMATANAASSVMALGTDPRFDVSRAFWIVAGIAGIDPKRGSLGRDVLQLCSRAKVG